MIFLRERGTLLPQEASPTVAKEPEARIKVRACRIPALNMALTVTPGLLCLSYIESAVHFDRIVVVRYTHMLLFSSPKGFPSFILISFYAQPLSQIRNDG